jgi:hypothetical protein
MSCSLSQNLVVDALITQVAHTKENSGGPHKGGLSAQLSQREGNLASHLDESRNLGQVTGLPSSQVSC